MTREQELVTENVPFFKKDKNMKELTMEEKAKRYDEAIEKAKYYYDEGKTLEYVNDIVSDIFPEFKESEDDNIRKGIIDIIKSQKEQQCHIDSTIYDKMLTWLEKQGGEKQDPCDNCNNVKLNCHNFPCSKKREYLQ